MGPAELSAFALGFAEVTEEQPFGPTVDVYKVAGKIFAILDPDNEPPRVSLKCEPNVAVYLRQHHDAISPGYHLNKQHWNTVLLDGSIQREQIEEMVEHSYEQVIAGLPKKTRQRLTPTAL